MSVDLRYIAAIDTPLGVEFVRFGMRNGGILITERILEACALKRGHKPAECELVTVVDDTTGKLIWPRAAA